MSNKPTRAQIDELAAMKQRVDAARHEAERLDKLYKRALAPVVEYVDSRIRPEQGMVLSGAVNSLEFGKQREVRKLRDPRAALSLLERVKAGLGFANISIPIAVLDKHLRAEETEGLFTVEYGARSVKVSSLD